MNSITELLSKRHIDGRKRLLVKATFLAKRQGWSKTKVEEKLIKKITTIDGLSEKTATGIVNSIYSKN